MIFFHLYCANMNFQLPQHKQPLAVDFDEKKKHVSVIPHHLEVQGRV